MTPEIEALARRAVAAVPIERWPEFTPVWFERDNRTGKACLRNYDGTMMIGWLGCRRFEECNDVLPLLDTPAGLGSLESVIRKAWGDDTIHVAPDKSRGSTAWMLANWDDSLPFHFTSRTVLGLLVSALEAAP